MYVGLINCLIKFEELLGRTDNEVWATLTKMCGFQWTKCKYESHFTSNEYEYWQSWFDDF